MKKWIAAAGLLTFLVPLSLAEVGIGPGVSIQQPENNVTVDASSKYNVSNIGVYSSKTGLDGSNFSVENTDGSKTSVTFDFYRTDAGLNNYFTNYTASTSSGNNLTFKFTGLAAEETYEVYDPSDRIRRKNTSSTGVYSFFYDTWDNEQSFSVYNTNNSRPSIDTVSIDVNESRDVQKIDFGLNDRGEKDIDSYSGISSITEFTNSTLKADFLFPFINTVTVNDTLGLISNDIPVDLRKSDTGHIQDDSESSSLSTQYLGQIYTVTNDASQPVNYSLTLSVPGELDSSTTYSGTLEGEKEVSHTAGNQGDWIDEKQYGFQVPDEVTLSGDYNGTRQMSLTENTGVSWSNISTTGFIDTPSTCTQSNQTSISVPASVEENRTVGYSCDPGDTGTPDLTVVNKTDYERIWYNTTLTVSSNLTENSSLVWSIDESNLKDYIERDGGSLEAMVNRKSSDVSVTDGPDMTYVTVEDDFGNSSLHQGTHEASLTYTIGDSGDDTDDGGSSGGGAIGGGGEEDDGNETETDYSIDFTPQERYTVAPGSTSRLYFTAWNYERDQNTLRIDTPDTQECSYFTVQNNLVGDEFSKSTSLNIRGTRQSSGSSTDIILMAKVNIPNRTGLQSQGLGDTFTCRFDTGAGIGEAGPLNLTVQAVDTTPRWVKGVRQLIPDLPTTSLIYSEEICLPEGGEDISRLQQVQRYLEEGQCSGSLHSIPLPTGEASALIFGAFVFVAGVTRFRGKVI